jgi:hypothetical protein
MRYALVADWSPLKLDSYVPLDATACPNTEWLRATTLTPGGANGTCTFQGGSQYQHLAWSIPMYQPTYFTPSVFIHSFVMFAPFLATPGLHAKIFGAFLFLTGPYMSQLITDDLNEQPAIWCFFSICQITLMFCAVLAIQSGATEKAATSEGAEYNPVNDASTEAAEPTKPANA